MRKDAEDRKVRALVLLVASGLGISAFAAASRLETERRERATAMENRLRNLEIGDGSPIPPQARAALGGGRGGDAFGLSPAMRGSLAEKGFSIVMDKTGAEGSEIQARAAGTGALVAFCSELLAGGLGYQVGSLKFAVDENSATSVELSSNGK